MSAPAAPPGTVERGLEYPFPEPPAGGETRQVAPGIHWLRMPLPFALDHINLWLLEDGEEWTVVDTGIDSDEVRELWRRHLAATMGGRPAHRVLVTHFHPDHIGLAGWLTEEWRAPLWITRTEWLMSRMLMLDTGATSAAAQVELYRENGLADTWLDTLVEHGNTYRRRVTMPPAVIHRVHGGDDIEIGGGRWRVIIGEGHCPEHACLYSEALGVLIAGDIVLPRITPNISLWAAEPDADPLALYLGSLANFRGLRPDTLVLPSHGRPFRGLETRLDQLELHHAERLGEMVAACDEPVSAAELIPHLFRRKLDAHQMVFAMGECLSHLVYLAARGELVRRRGGDGPWLYAKPGS